MQRTKNALTHSRGPNPEPGFRAFTTDVPVVADKLQISSARPRKDTLVPALGWISWHDNTPASSSGRSEDPVRETTLVLRYHLDIIFNGLLFGLSPSIQDTMSLERDSMGVEFQFTPITGTPSDLSMFTLSTAVTGGQDRCQIDLSSGNAQGSFPFTAVDAFMSEKVQQQAAAIEETSATMEEMNAAVQNNTENAEQASEVVEKVQVESEQASEVMTRTIDAMNSIQNSSNEIAEIVSLIDSIAFQTNLLALNAAVEAARAGEHGRGFAVVASEVRALAQKSADAAKDIKTLIDSSVQRIGQGTKLASESGEVIREITQSINNVATMIHHINGASQEQAEGVSQVYQAISDIDSATQANASLVDKTTMSANNMKQQASDLNKNMSFFKTNTKRVSSVAPSSTTKAAIPLQKTPVTSKTTTGLKPTAQMPTPSKPATKMGNQAKDNSDEWSEF